MKLFIALISSEIFRFSIGEKIYQQAGIDAYAGFGFAKVYTDKMAIRATDFLETKVLPVYGEFHIPLDRILTDNGKVNPE